MSILLTVRGFFQTQLLGVVPWTNVAVTSSNGQELYADVNTPKGHAYSLMAKSSYVIPPLGQVVLKDGDKEAVQGPNQDATWHRIAQYIKAKEGGASVDKAAEAASVVPEELKPPAPAEVDPYEPAIPFPPVVYYVASRGEFYRNGPALVTVENADGTLNLTVFANRSEPFSLENVPVRSDTQRHHCFVSYEPQEAVAAAEPIDADMLQRLIESAVGARLETALSIQVPAMIEKITAAVQEQTASEVRREAEPAAVDRSASGEPAASEAPAQPQA